MDSFTWILWLVLGSVQPQPNSSAIKVIKSHVCLENLHRLSKNIRVHVLQTSTFYPTSRKTQRLTFPHCLLWPTLQQGSISIWSPCQMQWHHHSEDFPAGQGSKDCWFQGAKCRQWLSQEDCLYSLDLPNPQWCIYFYFYRAQIFCLSHWSC